MPSLKAIRKRIVSVKNTRKITRAMKLVAAAKLRRAQDAIIAARPYSVALANVVSELAGLAGAFNSNVIRAVERYAANELTGANEVSLRIIGKKGNQHFTRRNARISSYDTAPTGDTVLTLARESANRVIADFIDGKVDRVYLAYNEFKNAGSQLTRVVQILPVKAEATHEQGVDYIYEPGKEELLTRLVPLYVQNQIFRANLESLASFFGAQMMAMENATKSAGEMIQRYTLQYNRARQASITKELLEIISGAEALKG